MRSSSVKTLVVTLFVAVTLVVSVPVDAASAPKRETTVTAVRNERAVDRVRRVIRRFLSVVTNDDPVWPSIPPDEDPKPPAKP